MGITVPVNLMKNIDLARGDITRSRFVTRMIEHSMLNVKVNENLGMGPDSSPAPIPKSSKD